MHSLRRFPARERGQSLVVMAFFLVGILVVFAILLDLIQVRQAEVMVETAAQDAAVGGARMRLDVSTLIPRGPGQPPRRLAIPDDDATRVRVRQALVGNLRSMAYLMDGTTPEQVASSAEIAIVNPGIGECRPSPFYPGPGRAPCYYDAFVAVRVRVPLRALWGATTLTYPVAVVGAITDDTLAQHPATPIPTSTPAPVPTFPLPRPTCAGTC
jgi:hypothetical protein